ncbi:hypothetical protein [Verminephrobacter aporrectodeae]|nr:hypothetical protein [Verminephrobacter aporrectodeae]
MRTLRPAKSVTVTGPLADAGNAVSRAMSRKSRKKSPTLARG